MSEYTAGDFHDWVESERSHELVDIDEISETLEAEFEQGNTPLGPEVVGEVMVGRDPYFIKEILDYVAPYSGWDDLVNEYRDEYYTEINNSDEYITDVKEDELQSEFDDFLAEQEVTK